MLHLKLDFGTTNNYENGGFILEHWSPCEQNFIFLRMKYESKLYAN